MLNQLLYISIFSIFLFSSCAPEPIISEVKTNEALFFIDNVPVEESLFPAVEDDFHIAITKREDLDTDEYIPVFNAFTTDELYINWGRANNYRVEMKLEMEQHLSNYAAENGYIFRFEQTGVVDQEYLNYEQKYVAEIKAKYGLSADSRANTLLRNTCGVVSDYWIFDTQPWLPSAHNNQISAVNVIQAFAFHSIYNRTFYRNNLGTYWDFGLNMHCWLGWFARFDNRMSSGMFI